MKLKSDGGGKIRDKGRAAFTEEVEGGEVRDHALSRASQMKEDIRVVSDGSKLRLPRAR